MAFPSMMWAVIAVLFQSGLAAVSLRKVSPSAAGSPSIATCFSRDVAPLMIFTLALGTPSALGSSSIPARLAPPPSAMARTRTLTTLRPSASVSIPSMSSRPPRGVPPHPTLMPAAASLQASICTVRQRQTGSEDAGIDVIGNHPLDEHDDQDHDDRRDVETAQAGQHPADRRQHGLGDPVQELGHGGNELVARIHDIEG